MALLEVRNATFSYDGKRDVFRNINMAIEEGQIFCIVGPNGSGKSTLLDCVLGLNRLREGEIRIEGTPIQDLGAKEYARRVAYVPQSHTATFGYTVLDIVTMGRTYAARMFSPPGEDQKNIARQALRQVGLAGFEDRDYTRLSGGEMQLVILARAIAQESKLLVMDEPTAHLDFTHEMTVLEITERLAREKGLSVLMATHFLNQAYFFENAGIDTRVALINHGGIAETGIPSQVLTEENLARNFNIVTEVIEKEKRKYILPLHNIR